MFSQRGKTTRKHTGLIEKKDSKAFRELGNTEEKYTQITAQASPELKIFKRDVHWPEYLDAVRWFFIKG